MTRSEANAKIETLARENGVRRESKSWVDYEKLKYVIIWTIPESDYELMIGALADFLGL